MNSPVKASRSDLYWSIAWIAVGMAIFHGGWSMDRLEKLNINPYTAPGLVPAALGVGIALLGMLLLVRSLWTPRGDASDTRESAQSFSVGRFATALVLCLVYGAGLVGRGVPFWLATFLFVFASIVILQWSERRAHNESRRGWLVAAACGAGTALAVTLVFQELFLVRLP